MRLVLPRSDLLTAACAALQRNADERERHQAQHQRQAPRNGLHVHHRVWLLLRSVSALGRLRVLLVPGLAVVGRHPHAVAMEVWTRRARRGVGGEAGVVAPAFSGLDL